MRRTFIPELAKLALVVVLGRWALTELREDRCYALNGDLACGRKLSPSGNLAEFIVWTFKGKFLSQQAQLGQLHSSVSMVQANIYLKTTHRWQELRGQIIRSCHTVALEAEATATINTKLLCGVRLVAGTDIADL